MDVSLTPELERFVHSRVESGQYRSASDVVRDALQLLEEREKVRESQRQDLHKKIDEGIASLDRGEGVDGEEFFEGLRRKSQQRRR